MGGWGGGVIKRKAEKETSGKAKKKKKKCRCFFSLLSPGYFWQESATCRRERELCGETLLSAWNTLLLPWPPAHLWNPPMLPPLGCPPQALQATSLWSHSTLDRCLSRLSFHETESNQGTGIDSPYRLDCEKCKEANQVLVLWSWLSKTMPKTGVHGKCGNSTVP